MILMATFKQDNGEIGYASKTYDCCQMESIVSHDIDDWLFRGENDEE